MIKARSWQGWDAAARRPGRVSREGLLLSENLVVYNTALCTVK